MANEHVGSDYYVLWIGRVSAILSGASILSHILALKLAALLDTLISGWQKISDTLFAWIYWMLPDLPKIWDDILMIDLIFAMLLFRSVYISGIHPLKALQEMANKIFLNDKRPSIPFIGLIFCVILAGYTVAASPSFIPFIQKLPSGFTAQHAGFVEQGLFNFFWLLIVIFLTISFVALLSIPLAFFFAFAVPPLMWFFYLARSIVRPEIESADGQISHYVRQESRFFVFGLVLFYIMNAGFSIF